MKDWIIILFEVSDSHMFQFNNISGISQTKEFK
jgi:hypothetical protein